ncbi:MAG: carbohydrate binding domain-containing protein [bacterium]|nr:carbohydrate binding domain-containing protein [bacterium]
MRARGLILIFFFFLSCTISGLVFYAVAAKLELKTEGGLVPHFNRILDDFNDGNDLNNWLYNTFTGGTNGTCFPSYSSSAYEGSRCLKLLYAVPGSGGFSWYASKLGGENAALSNFNGLSFWVKGSNGNELLKVEIKTAGCNSAQRSNASLYVNDFLASGYITSSWQQAVIPFNNFANITNFSRLEELTFVFEHDQSATNGSPLSGAVYLDRIQFTNRPGGFDPIIQDYCNDRIFRNSLGGNMGWSGGSGGTIAVSFDNTCYHSAPNSVRMDYNVTGSGAYSFLYTLFGGGNTGSVVQPCNFTNYTSISFWMKVTNKDPISPLQVEMDIDDAWPPYWVLCGSITTNWQKWTVGLTNFTEAYGSAKMSKQKLAKLVFTAVQSRLPANDRVGRLYIDDIRFEK